VHLLFCDRKGQREKAKRPWDLIPSGHRIGKPTPLFRRLVILWVFFLSFEVCNTMVLDALHLSHYLDFTDTIHYMQDDSTVKGFKEKFAGSQAEED